MLKSELLQNKNIQNWKTVSLSFHQIKSVKETLLVRMFCEALRTLNFKERRRFVSTLVNIVTITIHLTVHLGMQPVILCSWIHLAWRALVKASLYLKKTKWFYVVIQENTWRCRLAECRCWRCFLEERRTSPDDIQQSWPPRREYTPSSSVKVGGRLYSIFTWKL